MKSIKKCIYCGKYKTEGDKCVICNSFVCWDCLDKEMDIEDEIALDCVECGEMICKNCISSCKKCEYCEEYICNKCESKVCDVCEGTFCSECCETIYDTCPYCGNEEYTNICNKCLDEASTEGKILEVKPRLCKEE
ncbi:MAG: hypothetical protein ACO2O6_10550 [Candidatus Hydrothermia bacterium]|jgi:hypothetical protein